MAVSLHQAAAYDEAVKRLGFDEPAVKVASSEGVRPRFPWNRAFYGEIQERLDQGR